MTIASAGADAARLLGHDFAQPALLAEALTHPSALSAARKGRAAEGGARDRPATTSGLNFSATACWGWWSLICLWRRFDAEPEGPLTRRHAQLVRRETLAAVADRDRPRRLIRLSPAEAASGAARSPAILADVVEAVIAAIYLDGGFDAAFAFVERWWGPRLAEMERPPRDPKTLLQEWAQGRGLPLPEYRLVGTSGPDHALQFTIAVRVAGHDEASATASSKRAAETAAAAALLERLSEGARRADAEEIDR